MPYPDTRRKAKNRHVTHVKKQARIACREKKKKKKNKDKTACEKEARLACQGQRRCQFSLVHVC
jgi:hypothetical protein